MGFLANLVDKLPGSHQENPLMGGTTLSEFAAGTLTNDLSANGYNAIRALDPTITAQNVINEVDQGFGGNGNVFSQNSMDQQAGVLNTVGKIIASAYLGDVAGGASGSTAVGGATSGAALSSANGGSAMDGAIVGGIGGAFAPTSDVTPMATTTPAPTALEIAGEGALRGAAANATKAAVRDEDIGAAAAEGAFTGAIGTSTNGFNPAIAGAINGAVNAGIAYEKAGQSTENGILIGAISGGAGGYAGGEVYNETGSNTAASAAATVARDAAVYAGNKNGLGFKQEPLPPDPEFKKYMDFMQRGYSPQIMEGINPIILAAIGNNQDRSIAAQLSQQQGGITPLLTQGD